MVIRCSAPVKKSWMAKKTAMLDLTPKAALAGIRAVRLWMDEQKGVSLQVKVTETGGDYAIYKYSNIKINNPIPDSVFDLKLPSDVHVNKISYDVTRARRSMAESSRQVYQIL